MRKNKKVELPLIEPLIATYHRQGSGCAIIGSNPSIQNWYLNACVDMHCNRKFLRGYTTPEINIHKSNIADIFCFQKEETLVKYIKKLTCKIIKLALNDGKYVFFCRIDDYYIKGKTWYMERHFPHDGLIYGYDDSDKTFLMYAYDENWVYRCFKTPIKCFKKALNSKITTINNASITLLSTKSDKIDLNLKEIRDKLKNYLASSFEKYTPNVVQLLLPSLVKLGL